MKISVKVMLMSLAMIFATTLMNAQGPRGGDPVERAKKMTEHLTSELELNTKQAKKVEAINLKYAKKQQEIRTAMRKKHEEGGEVDRELVKETMEKMRTDQEEEIKGILTPSQIQKFDAMPKGKKGKQPKGKKSKGKKADGKQPKNGKQKGASVEERAEKQTARLTEKLELNAKQASKIEAINLKYAKQQKEMRDYNKDASDADKAAMKERMKVMRQAQETEIKAVLTPEQSEKFDVLKAERKGKGKKGKGQKGKQAPSNN